MTTTSARWPTVSRPRSRLARRASPGRRTPPGSPARAVSASSGPNGRRPGRPARDPRDGRPARSPATDRTARPARRCRTRGPRRSRRSTPTCSRWPRRATPHSVRACAASLPRWTGWTLAAIPAFANRPRSAGSSSWTCSILGMNGTAPAVGSRASSAARTAASPIAWICVAIPPAAASLDELAQPLGLGDPDAAPQLGRERPVRARARCRPAAPRSATRASRRRSTSASRSGPARRDRRRGSRRSADRRPAPCRARPRGATPWTRSGSRPVSDRRA